MAKGTNDTQRNNSINEELLLEIKKMEKELKRRYEEYEELNNSYREVYDSYIVSKTNLDETTNSYEGEILKLETMITEKENQYSDLHESFQELLEDKCKLEAELEGYQKAIYEMEENCASLKESHKEELKEIQEEISNLSSQMSNMNEELEFAKERCRELEKLNEERASTIETLNGKIEDLKEEKKLLGIDMEIIKVQQDRIHEEMKQLHKEKEEVSREREELCRAREELYREREELEQEKERIDKCRDELLQEKELIQTDRDLLGKERQRQENNMKNIIIKFNDLQKELDDLASDNSTKESCLRESEQRVLAMEKEASLWKVKSVQSGGETHVDSVSGTIPVIANILRLIFLFPLPCHFSPQNKIANLDQKVQELKSELATERQNSSQLQQDAENKTGELLKRDSIIQVLYSKLKEKEGELVLFQVRASANSRCVTHITVKSFFFADSFFLDLQLAYFSPLCHFHHLPQNENLSLKNHKEELSKIWDSRTSEMTSIEADLYQKLSNLIIKNKIRDRDDMRFDGHPQSFLLKTLWSGYVDICKSILKSRDGYLYSGSTSHRFICAYNTDLFLDVKQESAKKYLLSYRNVTRGIFQINEDEVKSLVYVGPLSKCQGHSVSPCSDKVNLEMTKGQSCNYVFEEMYVTKKGTKIVLIKEKQTGMYFSGLHRNMPPQENEKKKTGVDKLEYNNVVCTLINYMTNEEKEKSKGDIILKTSNQKVKIESGEESMEGVNKTRLVKNQQDKPNRGNSSKGESAIMGRNKGETKGAVKTEVGKKNTKLALPPSTVCPKGNYKQVKKEQKMSEENLHRYNIAKEMLLLPGSNDSSGSNGCDANNRGEDNRGSEGGDSASTEDGGRVTLFHLKNEYGNDTEEESKCVEKEKMGTSRTDGKNPVESFLKHRDGVTYSVVSLANTGDFNDTNIVLTINKEEAILFEVFNYEQIAEHDAVRFASEYVLHLLSNWEKGGNCPSSQDASSTTVCSEHNSNVFTLLDGDWCILPAYM
ncbi:autophagy-related protein 23, putative [Plasmodium knowlesi strain H]|uniref:Autophagy-related protein 23, putative n=1 Tax=Plasmodium knowlesi (strain H) TaxID=5851 RepID=A0A193QXV6_PLAKH|nr:autophagy-related protein 23, putative [Plasmodium knowlesi strain H]SBO20325.1 autophagy-related protein 23, putative [Plasmodium knowlesi strain H]